jgi:hypothetical protein
MIYKPFAIAIVLFLDESHLLHGDLTGYVWGQSQIRIEVPITNKPLP